MYFLDHQFFLKNFRSLGSLLETENNAALQYSCSVMPSTLQYECVQLVLFKATARYNQDILKPNKLR